MARAAAMGLPASLENLGAAIDADIQKDKDGHRLMLKMCKPRADGGWQEKPEDLERLFEYCANDVAVERQLERRLAVAVGERRRIRFLADRFEAIDVDVGGGKLRILVFDALCGYQAARMVARGADGQPVPGAAAFVAGVVL